MKRYYVALDLEMAQPSCAIIQIGAVIGDVKTHKVVDTFSSFVHTTEDVSPYITALTSITSNDVKNAPTMEEAYKALQRFVQREDVFINPFTWGGGDVLELYKQKPPNAQHIFGRRYNDVKTLYIAHRMKQGLSYNGGLSSSMTKLGLEFEGVPHNAMYDALNTWRMFCKLQTLS